MPDGERVAGASTVPDVALATTAPGSGIPTPRVSLDVTQISGPVREALTSRSGERHVSLSTVAKTVLVLDVVMMVVCLALAWVLRELVPGVPRWSPEGVTLTLQVQPLIILTWLVAMAANGAYAKRIFGAGADEYRSVAQGTVITALVVCAACFVTDSELSRAFVLLLFLVGAPVLMAERHAARRWVRRLRLDGRMRQQVLLVGSRTAITRLSGLLARQPHLGYHVVACTVTDQARAGEDGLPAPAVGSMCDIGDTCLRSGIDTVMVAGGTDMELREVAWALEGRDIDLVVVPHLADVSGSRMKMRPVGGLPLLHVEEPQAIRAGEWPKRVFDVVGASVGLLLISPLMVLVALSIKLSDGGPVFYRQTRIGLNGAAFKVWKFRSMAVNAEAIDAELRAKHGYTEGLFKLQDDPRVTRVGRFIRRYSIDELPQLFNVIAGTMSLVGPRPHMKVEVDTYTDIARRRLAVRPGMTGLWQVSGRSNLSWSDAVRLDLYYRDNWSMIWDVGIILKTVKTVVTRDGAY
jgi:exopolysaccharide biosynthesis polyprenyl glycosylphosphotransferase